VICQRKQDGEDVGDTGPFQPESDLSGVVLSRESAHDPLDMRTIVGALWRGSAFELGAIARTAGRWAQDREYCRDTGVPQSGNCGRYPCPSDFESTGYVKTKTPEETEMAL